MYIYIYIYTYIYIYISVCVCVRVCVCACVYKFFCLKVSRRSIATVQTCAWFTAAFTAFTAIRQAIIFMTAAANIVA